ncbi:MAG: PDZ domain-containing protein, partial [Syntrophales bacterium]
GKAVKSSNDLPWIVAETPVGKTVNVKLIRQGKEQDVEVTIVEMTEQRMASQAGKTKNVFGFTADNIKPEWRKQFDITVKAGVVVIQVETDSLADDAGIEPGDVIREVNKKVIKDLSDFKKAMGQVKSNESVVFLLSRDDQSYYVSIAVP